MSSNLGKIPWPPTLVFLESLKHRREDALLDYKREWHDFKDKQDKGEFVKDVLAMANAVSETQEGLLAIGMDETDTGSTIVGVIDPPSWEAISEILQSYSSPVPEVALHHLQSSDGLVSFLRISRSLYHPHYATRTLGKLDDRHVYCRRGPVNGVLSPRDLEDMIRQKESRLGPTTTSDPIQFGFLNIQESTHQPMGTVILRNVSDEPVLRVRSFLEVTVMRDSTLYRRIPYFGPGTLKPGEPSEFSFNATDISIHGHPFTAQENQAFDLTLIVQYQDRSGFIQERTTSLRVAR